jgi:hypothetical protein
MAYEHFMTLDTEAERVKEIHQQAESLCEQVFAEQCVVLASQLDDGREPSATLQLRATPAGIKQLMNALSSAGRVVGQSLKGEDLASPISDSAKQLQLLSDYRGRLEVLGSKTGADLDSMMKLNLELAEVQSRIEGLAGARAHLEQRVATRALNIEITASRAGSVWAPLGEAMAAFTGNVAGATSALLTLIAFLLPWAIAAALVLWGVRRWGWLREIVNRRLSRAAES